MSVLDGTENWGKGPETFALLPYSDERLLQSHDADLICFACWSLAQLSPLIWRKCIIWRNQLWKGCPNAGKIDAVQFESWLVLAGFQMAAEESGVCCCVWGQNLNALSWVILLAIMHRLESFSVITDMGITFGRQDTNRHRLTFKQKALLSWMLFQPLQVLIK